MTADIVKFPYSVSRRAHARRQRISKNGTPEERAAKAAANSPPASVIEMSPREKPPGCSSAFRDFVEKLSQITRKNFRPLSLVSASPRGDSVIGLSGRCALLPWWLSWLNCRSLLSTCDRLLEGFKFTGQRRDVLEQPLNLDPIG
jgi:hypothetical protein